MLLFVLYAQIIAFGQNTVNKMQNQRFYFILAYKKSQYTMCVTHKIPVSRCLFIYASNEPKSVLARDLGDCRDNLRNSRSVFLIVYSVSALIP